MGDWWRPHGFVGLVGEMTCYPQRADLSIVEVSWMPMRGSPRPMTIVGIARACAEARALAWTMVGMIVSFRPQGLN